MQMRFTPAWRRFRADAGVLGGGAPWMRTLLAGAALALAVPAAGQPGSPERSTGGGASGESLAVVAVVVGTGVWYVSRKLRERRTQRILRILRVPEAARYDDDRNGRISCREARSHGIAPVARGHAAFPFMRDRDGDGVACERAGRASGAVAAPADKDQAARIGASRDAVESFAGALRERLGSAMAAGGPAAAIEACKVAALEIAATES